MRTVEAKIDELLQHPVSEDYVFVKLLDEKPCLTADGENTICISKMQCTLKERCKDENSQIQMK